MINKQIIFDDLLSAEWISAALDIFDFTMARHLSINATKSH